MTRQRWLNETLFGADLGNSYEEEYAILEVVINTRIRDKIIWVNVMERKTTKRSRFWKEHSEWCRSFDLWSCSNDQWLCSMVRFTLWEKATWASKNYPSIENYSGRKIVMQPYANCEEYCQNIDSVSLFPVLSRHSDRLEITWNEETSHSDGRNRQPSFYVRIDTECGQGRDLRNVNKKNAFRARLL